MFTEGNTVTTKLQQLIKKVVEIFNSKNVCWTQKLHPPFAEDSYIESSRYNFYLRETIHLFTTIILRTFYFCLIANKPKGLFVCLKTRLFPSIVRNLKM